MCFERSRWRAAEHTRRSASVAEHRLIVVEAGGTQRTTVRIDGSCVYRGRDYPQAVSFIPAGVERQCSYVGVDLAYSVLRIAPDIESEIVGRDRKLAISPVTNVQDQVITCLFGALGEDLSRRAAWDRISRAPRRTRDPPASKSADARRREQTSPSARIRLHRTGRRLHPRSSRRRHRRCHACKTMWNASRHVRPAISGGNG